MKSLLGAILFSIVSFSSQAAFLTCDSLGGFHGDGGGALMGETFETDCTDRLGNKYELKMFGVGAGVKWSISEFGLTCPLVRTKKLPGNYLGVKLTAAATLGASAGVLTNSRLGVCFMTGVEMGLGALATVDLMKIKLVRESGLTMKTIRENKRIQKAQEEAAWEKYLEENGY